MSLQRENRDLRQHCALLVHPDMLRDMERTIGEGRKTRRELDALQSTHARIDDQLKNITGKIRGFERRKQTQARF